MNDRERAMQKLMSLKHEESNILNMSGYFRGYVCRVGNVYVLHLQDLRRTLIRGPWFYTDSEFETILDKLYKPLLKA